MPLPIFRKLRSKRPRGRGAYTLSETDLPSNFIFKDRSRQPERIVSEQETSILDKPITETLKPTKHLRPVKFEKAEDLKIDVDSNFITGLEQTRDPDKEMQWRYVQNNIHKLLRQKNINFTPTSISWDGYTQLDGKTLYADIKYLGVITPHTEKGNLIYTALKNGWIRLSKNQSNKLRTKDGLGITPIIYAYVILQHKNKSTEHKIFRLRDDNLIDTNVDQDITGLEAQTPAKPVKKRKHEDVKQQLFV